MVGVCLLLATVLPFSELDYKVVADYGFEELVCNNPEWMWTNLEDYPFSGVKVRVYTEQPGILLLSTTDTRGYLIMPPESRNEATTLFVYAKKYSNDDFKSEASKMPIAWTSEADPAKTNIFANVLIDTNFCWCSAIDISSISKDADLLINYGTVKSHRRVWIDRIIFARERKHGFYFIIR